VVIDLLELGLQLNSNLDSTSLGQALRRIDARLEGAERLTGDLLSVIDRHCRESQESLTRSLDRLNRLGVESVMILRRLAQLKGPTLLLEAQEAARGFVRERPANSLSSNDSRHNGEGLTE